MASLQKQKQLPKSALDGKRTNEWIKTRKMCWSAPASEPRKVLDLCALRGLNTAINVHSLETGRGKLIEGGAGGSVMEVEWKLQSTVGERGHFVNECLADVRNGRICQHLGVE
jgi:hypothetical protein